MILALGIGSAAVAQHRSLPPVIPTPKMKKPSASVDVQNPVAGKTLAPHATSGSSSNRVVSKTKLASSPNAFTLLVGESHPLHYNKATNLIAFTHRKTQSLSGTSGYVNTSFSTNNGATWDSTFLVYSQNAPYNGRYPTAGIYNPTGNTNPMNAYSVVSGPYTNSAWDGHYFASRQFDGTNNDQQVYTLGDPGVQYQTMPRIGSSAHPNGKFYTLGMDYDINSTAAVDMNGAMVNIGTFNPTTEEFDFTVTKVYEAFARDPNDNSQLIYAFPNMAWSKDGQVGYIVFLGMDSAANNPYSAPIIFRSLDAGATWGKLPVEDFSQLTALTDSLIPSDNGAGPVIPVFSSNMGWDLVVDGNNNLHIITVVYSGADAAATQIYDERRLFDVFMTGNGFWNAFNVATISAEAVPDANSAWTAGWDARIQGSVNDAGNIMFYSWMDTDPLLATENSYPDIWGRSLDITNIQAPMATNPTNFTAGTAYDGDNFWMYTAQQVMESGSGTVTYTIPTTTSMDWDVNNIGAGAIEHYYVSGISFTHPVDYSPVILSTNKQAEKGLTVSQNYPNPFNGTSMIDVNLPASSDLTFVVRNVVGQTVMSSTTANAAAGTHRIAVDASKLTAGVYFYTVTAGTQKVTKKMIIE